MVLPDSHGVSRVPRYWGRRPKEPSRFRLRGYHPLWPAFPDRSANVSVSDPSARSPSGPTAAHNPLPTTPVSLNIGRVSALPASLAATEGIAVAFSSSGY